MNKKELRKKAKEILKNLSSKRKKEAASIAFTFLLEKLKPYGPILSFAPFQDELDLWPINQHLVDEKRLLLPQASSRELLAFEVFSLQDLKRSPFGILEPKSPDPFPLDQIKCVLVPGLFFDPKGYRLGHGGGYYDRLLEKIQCPSFGIAYLEQAFVLDSVIEPHDKKVTEVFFF